MQEALGPIPSTAKINNKEAKNKTKHPTFKVILIHPLK
jgi:hypothetical protein